MKKIAAAFLTGLLFGLGLAISQMINPAKVLGFLDLFGNWDPSLALVMAAALSVAAFGYRLSWRRRAPLLESRFHLPERRAVDTRLLTGAALFGVGWGLAGYCPGPAVAALGAGVTQTLLFVAAMLTGMLLHQFGARRPSANDAPAAPAASSKT